MSTELSKAQKLAKESEKNRVAAQDTRRDAGIDEPEPVDETESVEEPETISEEEYQAQKADLEQQLADLELQRAKAETIPYPAWMYHETQGAKIVNSAEEAEALGEGWQSTPVLPPEAEPKPKAEPKAKAEPRL